MIDLKVCPSTLAEGYDTYSPAARKALFDGVAVSHYMDIPSPETDSREAKEALQGFSSANLKAEDTSATSYPNCKDIVAMVALSAVIPVSNASTIVLTAAAKKGLTFLAA